MWSITRMQNTGGGFPMKTIELVIGRIRENVASIFHTNIAALNVAIGIYTKL